MSSISRKTLSLLFVMFAVVISVLGQKQSKEILHFGDRKGVVHDISFLNGDSILVAAEFNKIKFYNTLTQEEIFEIKNVHNDAILTIDISADNSYLISAGKDSVIILWDIKNKKMVSKFDYHKGIVTSIKFSPDRRYILSGSTDQNVILYDLFLNEIAFILDSHTNQITSVAFSPDGKIIASASADKSIKLRDTKTGDLVSSINELTTWPRNVSFNCDGTKLISCGDDSKVRIWNISNIIEIKKSQEFKIGNDWLLSVDVYNDSKTFAAGGMDGVAQIDYGMGRYTYKLGAPITKIIFRPSKAVILKVAVATIGRGVVLISAEKMKMKTL